MINLIPNKYNMIVAADEDWCIGKDGALLDHFSEDMKYFRNITKNKIVVMGRKTQESLPNKTFLPNRINIIFSQSIKNTETVHQDQNALVFYIDKISTVPAYIKLFNHVQIDTHKYPNFNYMTDGDVFIIGGGQIYKQFLENDLIDTVYLTKIHHRYNGDTFIPNLWDLDFKIIDKLVPTVTNENGIKYDILVLKK